MKKKKMVLLIITGVIVPIVCIFLGHWLSLKRINYERAMRIADSNMTNHDYLVLAEKYFKTKDYISAASIYIKESMRTEPIALNNIAYMYEEGILYEKNIDKAAEFYEKAAAIGDTTAYENWVRFNIRFPSMSMNDFIEFIRNAIENNSSSAKDFINGFISKDYPMTIEEFLNMDNEDVAEVFGHQLGEVECDYDTYSFLSSDFSEAREYGKENRKKDISVSEITYRYKDKVFLAKYNISAEVESIFRSYSQYLFFYSIKNKPTFVQVE